MNRTLVGALALVVAVGMPLSADAARYKRPHHSPPQHASQKHHKRIEAAIVHKQCVHARLAARAKTHASLASAYTWCARHNNVWAFEVGRTAE
jgi:hypothetical protein